MDAKTIIISMLIKGIAIIILLENEIWKNLTFAYTAIDSFVIKFW